MLKYIMFKLINIIFFSLLLISCGSEQPTKYTFDGEATELIVSKMNDMEGMTCGIIGIMFSKEVLVSIADSTFDEDKIFDLLSEDLTPTTVTLYKDKLVWDDLKQETMIKDGKVVMAANDQENAFEIKEEGDKLFLTADYDGIICKNVFSIVN